MLAIDFVELMSLLRPSWDTVRLRLQMENEAGGEVVEKRMRKPEAAGEKI
jgi:hypothetical protein